MEKGKLNRVDPNSSHHKENFIFSLHPYEMIDIIKPTLVIIYVNQTIMLYILNLHSDIYQSFLNKTVNKG